MNSKKVLSIVIPSYNVSKYLPQVLPTYLIPEILQELELLIVNDGSIDNTSVIAMDFANKYPDTIKVINKENGGHGSTINAGARAASGQYFKVIDGDDWVDSSCLVAFIKELRNTNADVVLNSFIRVTEGTGEKELKQIKNIESNRIYLFSDLLPIIRDDYAMHGTTFKTEIYRKAKDIDEHCFYVDQEYLMYPVPYISNAIYYDIPVYQYRIGNAEQSMSLKNMQKNRHMHEKVIMSLLDMIPLENANSKAEELIRYRAAKMCQLHIDILFSLDDKEKAKEELVSFIHAVEKKDIFAYKSIPGKKAKILRLIGSKGYDFIKAMKRG